MRDALREGRGGAGGERGRERGKEGEGGRDREREGEGEGERGREREREGERGRKREEEGGRGRKRSGGSCHSPHTIRAKPSVVLDICRPRLDIAAWRQR